MLKIVLADYLKKELKEKCSSKPGELGFYMIGFRKKDFLVVDLVEFKYLKRNSVSVISDPNFTGFVFSTIPPVYRVVGTLHRHPGNMLSLSSTDVKNFKKWGNFGEHVHIIMNEECSSFAAYLFRGDYYTRIPVSFEPLNLEVEYITTPLPGGIRVYYLRGMRNIEIIPQFEKMLGNILRSLYIPLKHRGSLFDEFSGISRRDRGIIYAHIDGLRYPLMLITDGSRSIKELKKIIEEFFEHKYMIFYDGRKVDDSEKCRKYWTRDLYFRRV